MPADSILVITCGALAREIHQLRVSNGWKHMTVQAISAEFHNRPRLIPDLVREKIAAAKGRFDRIFVAYADCGTAGGLDKVIEETGVERLAGPHCYATFAGSDSFRQMADQEPGTFYLTDFLAQHFDRLVIQSLKLDTHPELRDAYFGNYTRLVYLAQTDNARWRAKAADAACRLGLAFEYVPTGYGQLATELHSFVAA